MGKCGRPWIPEHGAVLSADPGARTRTRPWVIPNLDQPTPARPPNPRVSYPLCLPSRYGCPQAGFGERLGVDASHPFRRLPGFFVAYPYRIRTVFFWTRLPWY